MTALHLHRLIACAPTPLAHYLKAVGILRLVSEQKDRGVRGWWEDQHFCLLTSLTRAELERFFLLEYAPTPLVAPWNKGSGFFTARDSGLSPLEDSVAARFAAFRRGIAAARTPLAALDAADKAVRALNDRTKAKKGMTPAQRGAASALKLTSTFKAELAAAKKRFAVIKADLFKPYELAWRGQHRAWMDAAVVLSDEAKVTFPSLLGTGGNDGRIDFTNNAMQRIGEIFVVDSADGRPSPIALDLLGHALWRIPTQRMVSGAVGQFLPGSAGGANSTTGADGDSLINPWDFLLTMEGAVLFSARATRRLDPLASSQASAPFAVRAHTIGHASAGTEKADRGEQWMPVWTRPCTTGDLRALLGEARVQLGRRTAYRPIDVARAVARLGVARGIQRFTRFGFLERNGQAKLAVPLGRVDVVERPLVRLVDDLCGWLDRLARSARDKNAPGRLVHAERRLANAVFAVLTHDHSPDRWQAVLIAAAAIEIIEAGGTAFKAGPIPPLSTAWVEACDDGSVEWRLARALGSAAEGFDRDRQPHNPVRHHCLPLATGAQRFREKDQRLVRDPRVVMGGRDPVADFGAVVERRLLEATQHGQRRLTLEAAHGCEAHPADIAVLISGRIDSHRVSALARAFMAVRWAQWRPPNTTANLVGPWPDEAWFALRLACLSWPLDENRDIPADDAIVRRLIAGDGTSAVDTALRRLRAAGLRPPLRGAAADPETARRWAAALAFPVSLYRARQMARSFEPRSRP